MYIDVSKGIFQIKPQSPAATSPCPGRYAWAGDSYGSRCLLYTSDAADEL